MTSDRDATLRAARDAINGLLQANATADARTVSPADEQELGDRAIETAARLRKVARELELHSDRRIGVSRKRGQRILGPYEERAGWRVVEVDAKGHKENSFFPTEMRARRYVDILKAELEREDHTTESALAEYERYLIDDKGNKPDSVRQTCYLIGAFFPESIPLPLLTPARIENLYKAMRGHKKENGEPRFAVDSHRSALSQVKTFLNWCVGKGWLSENPAAQVKGVGKRRPRGKSLGKSGNELRLKQAREWYGMAVFRAGRGDQGAIAALMACLLALRSIEIVSRKVEHLDEDEAPGDLLWAKGKTEAGTRTLEVPPILRPLLLSCAEGKSPERYLFEASRPHERHLHKRHERGWVKAQVHRICKDAKVPCVTAHAMRGLLATLLAKRGTAADMIAAMLGHSDARITMKAYAAPGAAVVGTNRRGLVLLEGGRNGRSAEEDEAADAGDLSTPRVSPAAP